MLVDVILIVVVSPGTRSKAEDLFKIAIETEKKIFGTFLGDVPIFIPYSVYSHTRECL